MYYAAVCVWQKGIPGGGGAEFLPTYLRKKDRKYKQEG